MADNNLDLIVDVIVTRDTPPLSQQDFNSAMFVTEDQVFTERFRQYTSAADLLTDGFDNDSNTYRAILTFFSQGGQVNEVTIGRRDATEVVVTILPANVLDTTLYSITVQDVVFSFTSSGSATAEEILDGLQAAIALDSAVTAQVTAISTGSSDFTDLGAVAERAILDPNDVVTGYKVLIDAVLGTATGKFVGEEDNIATAGTVTDLGAVDERAFDSTLLTPSTNDTVLVDSNLGTLAGEFVGEDGKKGDFNGATWDFTGTPATGESYTVTNEANLRYTWDGSTVAVGVNWTFGTTVDNDSVTVTDEAALRYIFDGDLTAWAEGAEAELTISENATFNLTFSYDSDEFVATYGGQEDWADALVNISLVYDAWYVLMTYDHSVQGILDIAAEIEARTAVYVVSNSNIENLVAVPSNDTPDPNNIRAQLEQLNYDRTSFAYSATADETYLEAGWVGERVWTEPGSSTWDLSAVKGVVADNLTRTEINILTDGEGNYFTTFGGIDYVKNGVVASGEFIDVIRGGDNMGSDTQIALVRTLGTAVRAGSKIPLTEKGMSELKAVVSSICEIYVDRNFIKDYVIEEDAVGNLTQRRGYEVTSALVSSLTTNQRASREAPDIQVVADLAGAVQKARVLINLFV